MKTPRPTPPSAPLCMPGRKKTCSVPKAGRCAPLVRAGLLEDGIVSPNAAEVLAVARALRGGAEGPGAGELSSPAGEQAAGGADDLLGAAAEILEAGVGHVFLHAGPKGAVLCSRVAAPAPSSPRFSYVHLPALPARVAAASGAGDCLAAAAIAALAGGSPPLEALALGVAAAKRAVESPVNVPTQALSDARALIADAVAVLQRARPLGVGAS